MANDDNVGAATLGLLEGRLRRVNFALTGDDAILDAPSISAGSSTTAARLRTLERHLHTLTTRCDTASEVLSLHASHSTIFHPNALSAAAAANSSQIPALAAIVLSHAQTFRQLVLQLETCKTQTIPDPQTLVPLVRLQPRIDKLASKQNEQVKQLAELRTRSAKVLESWYKDGVLEMSECWADWEERLRDVEILVRRMEATKRREEGFV